MKQTGEKRTWNSTIAALHVIAVFLVLPIIYRDFYYDILEVKYYFYLGCALVMAGLILGYVLLTVRPKKELQKLKEKSWRDIFSVTDMAVLVFGVAALISTLLSPFKWEAFWGNEGRYTGLFLLSVYVIVYFCLTRYLKFKRYFLDLLLISGMLVCLFGMTDFFDLDLLGFKEHIRETQRYIFTSFIGNINTYTALVAVYMGVAATLFATETCKIRTAIYYVCTVICFIAMITGISDNAYLAFMVLFGFLPLYLLGSRRGLRRYMVLVATFFTVIQLIGVVGNVYADQVVEISGMFNIIAEFSKLPLINLVLWAVTAILYVLDYKSGKQNEALGRWARGGWMALIILVACAVLFMLFDVNMAGNAERYGSLSKYLRLDDEWGTHRGYIWRIAIEDYMQLPILQKIFGYGPDTFGLLTYFNNLKEMTARYGELFDSVHNEYLQYFVTIGPIGCGAYLVILGSSFATLIKNGKENPLLMAVLFGVLCYSAQALVNINQPIATPIMWTVLCIGLAKCREKA